MQNSPTYLVLIRLTILHGNLELVANSEDENIVQLKCCTRGFQLGRTHERSGHFDTTQTVTAKTLITLKKISVFFKTNLE